MPNATTTQGPTLRRWLGLTSLTIYGVGNMLGAGIYALVGKASAEMGNAVWMAFAASMVAAALTGLSYACLGSRYPKAAGAAFVTMRAFRWPPLPYVVGLAVMASGLTSMAAASHAFSEYLFKFLYPQISGPAPVAFLSIVPAVFLIILAFVNFWGIRESALLNMVCTIVEASGLLFVIAIGIRFWGSVDYLDATSVRNPAGTLGLSVIMHGAVLTFFAFIGFEDLLNVSEEVTNPRRTFPLAVVLALSIVTCIYMAVSITAVSVVPHDVLANTTGPLTEVVSRAAPWLNPVLFSIVALFAVTNTALLNSIMGTRLAYGMARQGLLPAILGVVHARRRTPHVAVVVVLGIALVLALAGDISTLAGATSLLLLASFSIVNASLVVLKLRKSEQRGGFEVPTLVPIAGSLVCVTLIGNNVATRIGRYQDLMATPAPTGGFASALRELLPIAIALGFIGLFCVMFLVLRPKAVDIEVDTDTAPLEADPS